MTTETTTTEQSKVKWVVVDGEMVFDAFETSQLVFIASPNNQGNMHEQARLAMRDPANVLNVSALPKVVEALGESVELIKSWHGEPAWDIYDQHSPEMKRIHAALSLVHPHTEDKR